MRCSRLLLQKLTTGIVGLPVNPRAKSDLIASCHSVLNALTSLPKESSYRAQMEIFYKNRLNNAKTLDNIKIEDSERGLQIEQLIDHADSELKLIALMQQWKL
jgi:NADH dehydrogenase (ubiquinone) 1 alpha subcomplex subunit 5